MAIARALEWASWSSAAEGGWKTYFVVAFANCFARKPRSTLKSTSFPWTIRQG